MTRTQILEHQLKKSLTEDDYVKVTEDDKSFVLAKATQIVDGYVNYKSGSELDYIICDIALDMIINDTYNQIDRKPMNVPSNVASIKEGDTIITFSTSSEDKAENKTSSISGISAYYIDTYRDDLNRYRKLRR